MASKFAGKTKADLVTIARISGLLKTTVSQKMSKAELLEFLENADAADQLSSDDLILKESAKTTKQDVSIATQEQTHPDKLADKDSAQSAEQTLEEKTRETKKSPTSQDRGSLEKGRYKRKKPRKAERSKSDDTASQQKKARTAEKDMAGEVPEDGDNSEEQAGTKKIQHGVLEIMPDGYGFVRIENYIQSPNDLYLPPQYIKRFKLRTGDLISGPARQQRDNDRYPALYYVKNVNGHNPDEHQNRPHFERLTPIYPDERYSLETKREEISCRVIDLISPIGKGQRGMIVSPPKAGKTVLLKKIANAITENSPQTKLFVLLIDERPEEVTDMQRSIKGEVVYSTFDKSPENHVKITELVLERAKRLVELGEDVVVLLDSITRMSRAYNLTINPTGRTLSGGLDPGALYGPKRFFGAARNIENAGSLTIIATALVDTGSRMDEVIFEEFKGTGNMEVYLDRKLAEKRIFPAIDMIRSGTRREELLLSKEELDAVWGIRRAFGHLETTTVTESLISLMLKTKNNAQFVTSINVSLNDQQLFDAMRSSMVGSSSKQNNNGNTNGSSW